MKTFIWFLLYRLSSTIFVQTSYAPDEYWQSLEVAHRMAFGYGYLTWEWKHGIRSYIYPFIFFVFYKILDFISLDIPVFLITIPKILQSILTAISDLYFFSLCKYFYFQEHWIKVAIFTNWFWYYCGSRTIINTLETCLTIIALYYYPWMIFTQQSKKNKKLNVSWNDAKNNTFKYMILAAINCLMRPTAATIWGPLVLFQLLYLRSKSIAKYLLFCILPILIVILAGSVIIDYFWYGEFVIPAYNFLKFNLFNDIASHYGTHSSHWYLSQGLPVVLGLQYIPFILGVIFFFLKELTTNKNEFKTAYLLILCTIILNIITLSIIPHKEFRFLLPLTPLMMLMAIKFESEFFFNKRRCRTISTILLSASFLIFSTLFGLLHQRGGLALMEHLRWEISSCNKNCSFLFLMPCHSTPLYSHLHVNISTRFLECEPPLSDKHFDESEIFFANPRKWLDDNWNINNIPTHISIFDTIENKVNSFLLDKGYKKSIEILHSVLLKKGHGRYVVVYRQ